MRRGSLLKQLGRVTTVGNPSDANVFQFQYNGAVHGQQGNHVTCSGTGSPAVTALLPPAIVSVMMVVFQGGPTAGPSFPPTPLKR
jgi:hypothetical protein